MFKDQRGMHQGYRSETQAPFREVATVEFQAGDPAGPDIRSPGQEHSDDVPLPVDALVGFLAALWRQPGKAASAT